MSEKEIQERMNEIKKELDGDVTVERMNELENEVASLKEQRQALKESVEKRTKLLNDVVANATTVEKLEERKEEFKMEENIVASKEYRIAYLKRLMGKELNEVEERAYTSAANSAGAVMPTTTSEEIIKKVKDTATILNEVTLLHANGNVRFAVEGIKTAAGIHTENASITADSDTLVTVSLAGYEITKLIQVSASVKSMSIDSFEQWLEDMIVEMVVEKIEDFIFNGTGSSQPTGVEASNATWTDGTNAVIVGANASLTAGDVRELFGLLGAYSKGAKIAMNRKTLFMSFLALQDDAKHDLVRHENGKYYVYDAEVIITDAIADDTAYLGNFKKYVANLANDIEVKNGFDIDTNSNKYLGVAIFDGKPAIAEAFVKLGKASA